MTSGAVGVVLVTTALTVLSVALITSMNEQMVRDMRSRVSEQNTADEIVASVNGQILASYRQLQYPGADHEARFDSLGRRAFDNLRLYLFQDMSLTARLAVESLRELHQSVEVTAHRAFELSRRGDVANARKQVAQLEADGTAMLAAVDRFVSLREQERAIRQAHHSTLLQRLVSLRLLVGLGLIIVGLLFVRLIRRHVIRPLESISAAAARLGGGDLTVRMPMHRHQELNVVAASFNDMAERMQVVRDEIERRNLELSIALGDLRATQNELLQQEKMSAIGLMLAGLAHELNNPLAGILGTAQCLQTEMSTGTPAMRLMSGEMVTPLIAEAQRAGGLVRNLLLFTRKSTSEVDTVNVKEALDVAAGLRAYAFAHDGKQLLMEVPDDLHVSIEAQRFEHVAMNIMTNALDAMRSAGGGELIVKATRDEDAWITLTFSDDGPGFTDPSRVFDAFYTTKPVGTGTGLGLTLVHRFVTEFGGTIAASNLVPHGACITIRLPEAAPVPAISATAERRIAIDRVPSIRPRSRILVVDDEAVLRTIQQRLLKKMGHDVVLAKHAADAISILAHEQFDAVITDIRMPGQMDGIALFEWIRVNRPGLAEHCLFITGDIGEWASSGTTATHGSRVLAKPFEVSEYIEMVDWLTEQGARAAA